MMATLQQLYQIEVDSKSDPGSPEDPNIAAAVALRGKIRMALVIHAWTLLGGGKLNDGGSPSGEYPMDGEEKNNAVAWAQRVVIASPEPMTDAAMRLALGGGEQFTSAQILGASDQTIKSSIEPLIPALAKGLHPGQ